MKPITRRTEIETSLLPSPTLPAFGVGIAHPGPATWWVIDCEPLEAVHKHEPGFYWGANGGQHWKFAALFESLDDGEKYQEISRATNRSTFGQITGIETDGKEWFAIIHLGEFSGELETISDGDLKFGGNTAYTEGEIFQFKTAELIGANCYRISGFPTFPNGPHWLVQAMFCDLPIPFFMLSHYCVWHPERCRELLDQPRLLKCCSEGETLEDVEPASFVNRARWWAG